MNEINDNKKAMSEDVKQALIRFNKDNIYVQNLKIELVDMSLGYVKGKMMVTEDVLNPYGSVHGGCLYSLALKVPQTLSLQALWLLCNSATDRRHSA